MASAMMFSAVFCCIGRRGARLFQNPRESGAALFSSARCCGGVEALWICARAAAGVSWRALWLT